MIAVLIVSIVAGAAVLMFVIKYFSVSNDRKIIRDIVNESHNRERELLELVKQFSTGKLDREQAAKRAYEIYERPASYENDSED